ncbi:hypothetical protein AB0D59_27935 [Streptomyces sp. NPDC048417]|uniref:hypothetical protein n=1 Tax=Streptomyces sp. NPDC048417 TaxID=3155387 RepID=UPI00342C6946
MDESLPSSSGAGTSALRKLAPPPALCGFLLLLALVFTVSYAVGAAAGPVAPGIHGTDTDPGGGGAGGIDNADNMGSVDNMGNMGDMGTLHEGGN